jgi:RNA polymerase-binding transcription factor DksA
MTHRDHCTGPAHAGPDHRFREDIQMGTTQHNATTSLTKQQLATIRAELQRESVHHEGTLRHDVITAAIERIDAGTYGTCLDCGAAIPYERLSVMPETDRCVACSPVH